MALVLDEACYDLIFFGPPVLEDDVCDQPLLVGMALSLSRSCPCMDELFAKPHSVSSLMRLSCSQLSTQLMKRRLVPGVGSLKCTTSFWKGWHRRHQRAEFTGVVVENALLYSWCWREPLTKANLVLAVRARLLTWTLLFARPEIVNYALGFRSSRPRRSGRSTGAGSPLIIRVEERARATASYATAQTKMSLRRSSSTNTAISVFHSDPSTSTGVIGFKGKQRFGQNCARIALCRPLFRSPLDFVGSPLKVEHQQRRSRSLQCKGELATQNSSTYLCWDPRSFDVFCLISVAFGMAVQLTP